MVLVDITQHEAVVARTQVEAEVGQDVVALAVDGVTQPRRVGEGDPGRVLTGDPALVERAVHGGRLEGEAARALAAAAPVALLAHLALPGAGVVLLAAVFRGGGVLLGVMVGGALVLLELQGSRDGGLNKENNVKTETQVRSTKIN